VVKFHFINSDNVRKTLCLLKINSKFHISKSRGAWPPCRLFQRKCLALNLGRVSTRFVKDVLLYITDCNYQARRCMKYRSERHHKLKAR